MHTLLATKASLGAKIWTLPSSKAAAMALWPLGPALDRKQTAETAFSDSSD
jgi:hypothetical protein